MCQPRSHAECEASVSGFFDELYALREKHKIADINLTCRVVTEDGDAMLTGHIGDIEKGESMAAFAFGQEQSERQHRISAIIGSHPAIRTVKA